MKPRKKYRPKRVLANPVGYVMEGMAPVTSYGDYLIDLNIKHHHALAQLTQGAATKPDLDTLISGSNMTEALLQMGIGKGYEGIAKAGQDALFNVASRGAKSGRFVLRGEEMQAINMLFELHEAQLDIATVKDVERAIEFVWKELRGRRMRVINK